MNTLKRTLAIVAMAAGVPMLAAPPASAETLRYDWKLRGGLSWVAGLRFPTSGVGILKTEEGGGVVDSHLRVSAGNHDYIEYRSRMDDSASRTLRSENGYAFGSRAERKETVYDYAANVARLQEREAGRVENKTRPLAADEARDILTTIAYLRDNAGKITSRVTTEIYAEGKPYSVLIQPEGTRTINEKTARGFRVSSAPGAAKKFPGMTVWISEDAQRLPLRIVLQQKYASLHLELKQASSELARR